MKNSILELTVIILASQVSYGQETGQPDSTQPWTMHKIYRATRLCNGLDAADADKDGLQDYITNFEDSGKLVLMRNPGTAVAKGAWPATVIGRFRRVESSCFGDLDGDGWPDVAVAHGHEDKREVAGVTIMWHPGKSSPTDTSMWKNSDYIPGSVELGNYLFIRSLDVNQDGALDLVAGGRQAKHATERVSDDPSVGVVWLEAPVDPKQRRNMKQWKVHDIDSDIISGHGFNFGDIDGDGDTDIALANADWGTPKGGNYIMWYENPGKDSDKLRSPWKRHDIYNSDEFYTKPGIVVADLNRDGHADILSQVHDNVLYFRNKGVTPVAFELIAIPKQENIRWRARPIETADLDGDGREEIVIGLIHKDGTFPKEKAALAALRYTGDAPAADNWQVEVIKWSDGFNKGSKWHGEKWDNMLFKDLDADGDLDIVANCEEYGVLGVEWFENPRITRPVVGQRLEPPAERK